LIEYQQTVRLPVYYTKYKIAEYLLEDIPDGDKTTEAIFTEKDSITAVIQAEEEIVFVGNQIFNYFFDDTFKTGLYFTDGQIVKKDEIIGLISGRPDLILSRERVLLNILQRLCGIATLTKKYVDIAKPYGVKILDTRKTTPGLRLFEKYAVVVGGGYNHRMDLSSGILIKDNHIKAAGSIREAIKKVKEYNKEKLPVEIEVETIEEIIEALSVGVDGFLLDNMNRDKIIECVELVRREKDGDDIFLEASGGITLDNLKEYVDTGINAISSGELTHSVKSSEIHIEFL